MTKIKIIVLSLICILVCFINGCTSVNDSNSDENRKNITFITKSRSGDYWNVVRSGAEAAAKEFNVNLDFTAPDYEKDIEEQIKLFNSAVEKKADAIVISVSDYEKLGTPVENAYSKKIPVIIFDSGVRTNKISTYIGTDNYEAGIEAGGKLVELVGTSAKIAIMNYIKGSENAKQREEGVLKVLSQYPKIEIVAKEYCNSDENIAVQLTKGIISENEDISGIIALNASASEGVAQAVEEMEKGGKVKIVCFDSSSEEIEYMDRGVIQATLIQNPFSMGYLSVKYSALAARGNKIPKSIDTDYKIIDKDNMYSKENERLMFPFIH